MLPDNQAAAIPAIPTISETVTRFVITQEEAQVRLENFTPLIEAPAYSWERQAPQSPFTLVVTYFVLAYPFGVLVFGMYYAINYMIFAKLYRRRNRAASLEARAVLADLCKGRVPSLYSNVLAATPMLIGIFRPSIILPEKDYTTRQLAAILSHELTHLRRKDTFVKWLTLIASALHWFNPIMWLVRREIDRACELSCDEAVIQRLDTHGKQSYGDTLILASANPKSPRSVISATMCEEKKNLKERLGAIMKSRKHTRLAVVVSVFLFAGLIGASFVLGANTGEREEQPAVDAAVYGFDIELLSVMRTPFVGDNSAVSNIVRYLPVPEAERHVQQFISIDGYQLTVYFEPASAEIENATAQYLAYENAYLRNAAFLFALIDNLDMVHFAFRDTISGGELDRGAYTSFMSIGRSHMEYLIGMRIDEMWADSMLDVSEVFARLPVIGAQASAAILPYRHIEEMASSLTVAVFDEPGGDFDIRPANIIDTRINRFDMVAEFDHLLPVTVEMWLLDFMVQTDDFETETLRWGTFFPDEDGWVGHHTAWNDARVFMVFTRDDNAHTFMGVVPRWIDMHEIGGFWEENPERLEYGIRAFLDYITAQSIIGEWGQINFEQGQYHLQARATFRADEAFRHQWYSSLRTGTYGVVGNEVRVTITHGGHVDEGADSLPPLELSETWTYVFDSEAGTLTRHVDGGGHYAAVIYARLLPMDVSIAGPAVRTAIILNDTLLLNPYVITVDDDMNEVTIPFTSEFTLYQNDLVVVLPNDGDENYYKVQMGWGDPPRPRGHIAASAVSFDSSLFVNANQCILIDATGFDGEGNEIGVFSISGTILERRDGMILVTVPSSADSVWFEEADAIFHIHLFFTE